MTTLVGIQTDDFVVLAGDSQFTLDDKRIISTQTPKIFEVGKYVVGYGGNLDAGQIVQYRWKPPLYKGGDPSRFMGSVVIPSIAAAFKENDYVIDTKEMNFALLVAFGGNLFAVNGDLSFNASERGISVVGSGGPYAQGYLYSLKPESYRTIGLATGKAKRAIEIAALIDVNTSAPIKVITQGKRNDR